MRNNDKRKSTTFQRIMENNPENIFAQIDGFIKKRHGGLAIKSSRSTNTLNETNNDLNKYKYNCLTIIEDQKISKLREEIFNFTKQLEDVKRTNDDLNKKLTIVRENLFELEIIKLKPLRDELKRKERKMEINKTKKQNTTDSEFKEYFALFALKETISDKELEIEKQRNIKKELNNNIEKNISKIEELENTISKLNNELDSYSDDWMPLSLKNNINRRIELQRKIDEEDLTEEQILQIFSNISKLKKEIKKE